MANSSKHSILIINPNTTTGMTDALKPMVNNLGYTDIHFDFFTAPESRSVTLPDGTSFSGVPSINNAEHGVKTAIHCMDAIKPLIPQYDGFLVCCFSSHPLTGLIKEAITELEETESQQSSENKKKYVTGIFEASIGLCISLTSSSNVVPGKLEKVQSDEMFGIVSTNSKETHINGVKDALVNISDGKTSRFAGVGTTGLTAIELHTTPPQEVEKRMIAATENLLKEASAPVSALCLGCAGMANMDKYVRQGCINAYGESRGNRVRIVDGVVAGVGILVNLCKAGF